MYRKCSHACFPNYFTSNNLVIEILLISRSTLFQENRHNWHVCNELRLLFDNMIDCYIEVFSVNIVSL